MEQDMPRRTPVGREITKLRKARGWSLSRLARESGLSRQGLTFIEEGYSREPTTPSLRALAGALGVPLARLLG
jgi:transcriptional regulator with XRE-family HTH domain